MVFQLHEQILYLEHRQAEASRLCREFEMVYVTFQQMHCPRLLLPMIVAPDYHELLQQQVMRVPIPINKDEYTIN